MVVLFPGLTTIFSYPVQAVDSLEDLYVSVLKNDLNRSDQLPMKSKGQSYRGYLS